MDKMIYFFNRNEAEGNANMKNLLGGKGANLAEMCNIGIPVPPGFTITTEVCRMYYENDMKIPDKLLDELNIHITRLEQTMNARFNDDVNPLLVSVRSGAAQSMPGMMDTVLNLGINRRVVDVLTKKSGNKRFAFDVYRRFMQMFGDVVMGIPHAKFESVLETIKRDKNISLDTDLDEHDLEKIIDRYREIYHAKTGEDFPEDPYKQLVLAIEAVFRSWNNPRAIKYRRLNNIKGLIGTAVNVQAMVFGNMGENSGTGVCFTRDPASGENKFYGEYLMNAQGEDVVAGIRTPQHIETLSKENKTVYDQLLEIRHALEAHYKDMQDIEFTIERGKLYILQTRTGKRTVFAALNIAVDMVNEGLISVKEALFRVDASNFNQLFAPVLDRESKASAVLLTKALNASPGGASGKIVFTADEAERWASNGENVILCRLETSPEDIGGMAVAKGVLTARGGMTSHAAVVARGMGIPCVAGASELHIDCHAKILRSSEITLKEGDMIAIDGFTGEVFAGNVTVKPSEIVQVLQDKMKPDNSRLYRNYATFMAWADKYRKLGVRTNADTPKDTQMAVMFGAEGIGLCRTEHMFFEGNRIVSFRKLVLVAEEVKRIKDRLESGDDAVLSDDEKHVMKTYQNALDELLPLQRNDFMGIFEALDGRPCTIRLLDPPLHEFLPKDREGQQEMAKAMGVSLEHIKRTVESLHEFNPMLGHRGCRLGITYPEVSEMQVRAIIEAALIVHSKGIKVCPEIMIPLVGHKDELKLQRAVAEQVIVKICKEKNMERLPFDVAIGTMIEVPRAAITADEIAEYAEFFSFGTNDLTQMGCGFSRDDAGKFLPDYVKLGIYEHDPFQVLDQNGVGLLVKIAVEKGRKVRPSIKIGICGEHGGEPRSVGFCHRTALDYVSCSPFRVPIARLAAAQAALSEK